jgi:hypothetical protein
MNFLHPKYMVYGLLVLGVLAFAEYRGWSPFNSAGRRETVPHSVRDNPGAYRAHYVGTGRYIGGK